MVKAIALSPSRGRGSDGGNCVLLSDCGQARTPDGRDGADVADSERMDSFHAGLFRRMCRMRDGDGCDTVTNVRRRRACSVTPLFALSSLKNERRSLDSQRKNLRKMRKKCEKNVTKNVKKNTFLRFRSSHWITL